MKLLLCCKCSDVVKLAVGSPRLCHCGACSGYYMDNAVHAVVHGPRDTTFVLGFANHSLSEAVNAQLREGDLPPTMLYCGKRVSPGREFDAFIIPASSETVKWRDDATK